jgi:hypothetical protein
MRRMGVPERDRAELANAIAVVSTGEDDADNIEIVSNFTRLPVVRKAKECADLLVASAEEAEINCPWSKR